MSGQRDKLPQHALPRGLTGRLSYTLMHFMHKEIYDNVVTAAALRPDDILLGPEPQPRLAQSRRDRGHESTPV